MPKQASDRKDKREAKPRRQADGSKVVKSEVQLHWILLRIGSLWCVPIATFFLNTKKELVIVCSAISFFSMLFELCSSYWANLGSWPFHFRLAVVLLIDAVAFGILHSEVSVPRSSFASDALNTISVVIPCANETHFVLNTIRSIYEATPADQLQEIVVIDDGSLPRISDVIPTKDLQRYRTRIMRHEISQGLIRSKKNGADSTEGDIIVFLDCHVKPIQGWTDDFFSNIRENPKRIVVPTISFLDPDTWQESNSAGGQKMCMTWNADMFWCDHYPGQYVPILSGGLLAISRYWWEMSGGYDEEMLYWGGENFDQSLRTWLCGGEIVAAATSRVAHMWRDAAKPQTALKYQIPTEHVRRNRMRAATSWMGEWSKKVLTFPEFEEFATGEIALGSLENVRTIQNKLKCKGFEWYLNHFQDLYLPTGGLPKSVFNLRDKVSGLCLHHELNYLSNNGGDILLRPCNRFSEAQRFHEANRDFDGKCCSGIKLWDIDVCLSARHDTNAMGVEARSCDSSGYNFEQLVNLLDNGMLFFQNAKVCVTPGEPRMNLATVNPNKAMMSPDVCNSRVEKVTAGALAGNLFKLVAGTLCLSLGAGSLWEGQGRPLLFLPCDADDQKQMFGFGGKYPGGDVQIVADDGSCIDTASGEGPIAYTCHPLDVSTNTQRFNAKVGSKIFWVPEEDVELCMVPSIVSSPEFDLVSMVPCAASEDGVPKSGQKFESLNMQNDGSFHLRESNSGRCVSSSDADSEELIMMPCEPSSDMQRWVPWESTLKNLATNNCIADGPDDTPALHPCSPFQKFRLRDNGWVEKPRDFQDNGRARYLGKCFDTEPVEAITLLGVDCADALASGTSWERIWQETPLETRLFIDASKLRGVDVSFQ